MLSPPKLQDSYFAVLDIGSNSVRFVVYTDISRSPDIVFNEKVLCGLGRDVGTTGAMDQGSMDAALVAIKRFAALCSHMQIKNIYAFATAAVRDASNGKDFIKVIEKVSSIEVDIIDGKQEARLAALGVLSGHPHAEGIVGDMGGGSLELARISGGKVHECISLPIGSLRLNTQTDGDRAEFKQIVKKALKSVDWLQDFEGQTLYLVGGAWRNIARLLLVERHEPIAVLHGYSVLASDMRQFASALSKSKLKEHPNKKLVPPRRRDILPVAAYMMKKLISVTKMEMVTVSSFGVREGVNFDRLDSCQQKLDPFLNQCMIIAQERCRFPEHGDILYDWVKPLFPVIGNEKSHYGRLNRAVCLLGDIAWRAHPDYKAERAVELALHGRWFDVSHRDRAYMGVALNQAYGDKFEKPFIKDVMKLLTSQEQLQAMALGAALRLGQRLSGGAIDALSFSKLQLDEIKVKLVLEREHEDLIGDIVKRRLSVLANLLDRDHKIIFQDRF